MTYVKGQWVDDDGSGTTGTSMSAARMGNIEQGIADAHYPPVVANLPLLPADGQLARLLVDDGTYGGPFVWTVRYRQASTSAYKWDVLDAQPLVNGVAAVNVSPNNTNANDFGSNVIWLPFGGDWLLQATGNRILTVAGNFSVYAYLGAGNGIGGQVGAATFTDGDGGYGSLPNQFAASPFSLRDIRKNIPPGNNAMMRYLHNAANLNVKYSQAILTATPLRIG